MAEGLKVLFVEDDPAVRFGGVQALSLAGLEVEAFDSAEAVRPRLHPYFPGVLVTDVKMRGMSGLELLTLAREIDPTLPVILVTGHGDIAMAVQAMQRRRLRLHREAVLLRAAAPASCSAPWSKRRLTFEVHELRDAAGGPAGHPGGC